MRIRDWSSDVCSSDLRIRRHLRPLYVALDFAGTAPDNPWLAALTWAKSVFAKQQRLSQRPLDECPAATLPKRLRPYLLMFDAEGTQIGRESCRERECQYL